MNGVTISISSFLNVLDFLQHATNLMHRKTLVLLVLRDSPNYSPIDQRVKTRTFLSIDNLLIIN